MNNISLKKYFSIHLIRLYRNLLSIGLLRLIIVLGLISFACIYLFIYTTDKITAIYISLGWLALLSFIHIKRTDKNFLKTHFHRYKSILFTEYTLLSVPVLTCLLIHQHVILCSFLFLLSLIIQINSTPKYKSINTFLQRQLPSECLEWKAGIRKYFFIIIPLWTVAACTSFFIGSVPAAIFIIGITVISFYEKCESIQELISIELSAKKFLFLKIKRHTQLLSIIVLPLLLLFILFHIELWYIPVIEFFLFLFLHIYIITTKYTFYQPNSNYTGNQTYGTIGILGCIIPLLLPVVWLLTIRFYYKSIKNLNFYLDDYN